MGAAILQMGLLVLLAFEWEGWKQFAGDSAVFSFLTFFTGGFTGALQSFLQRLKAPGRNSAIWISIVSIVFPVSVGDNQTGALPEKYPCCKGISQRKRGKNQGFV